MDDARRYARSRLDPDLGDAERAAAERAIDDAVYGFMMMFDGVTGSLRNASSEVRVRCHVQLRERRDDGLDGVVEDLDLFDGDGACMGFHQWIAGDFGDDPVVV